MKERMKTRIMKAELSDHVIIASLLYLFALFRCVLFCFVFNGKVGVRSLGYLKVE